MEAAMWGGAITRLQLQQTISRLQKLDELPEEIASNLAFLSATTDESLKVMAVCVEEHYNGEGITIRIASNTGVLSAVIQEFMMLAKILEQAARRG
jgi:hypothetical protein